MQCAAPWYSAKADSNPETACPPMKPQDSIVAAIAASISSLIDDRET
jgi:hypothetical protein